MLGNDLAYLDYQESLKTPTVQVVTRSQSKRLQDTKSDFSSDDSLDGKLMLQQLLVTKPGSAATNALKPDDLITTGSAEFKGKQLNCFKVSSR